MKKYIGIIMLIAFCLVMMIYFGSVDLGDYEGETTQNLDETKESTDDIVIGFSQLGTESDWRIANTESMKATFSDTKGYELLFDNGQQKLENQIRAIRKFILREVDYIILAPVTESGWDTVLAEAKEAGIPVIIIDRMVDVEDDSLYTAWVGSDFRLEGEKACQWLKAFAVRQKIQQQDIYIVNIQGTIGATAQIGRTRSLEKAARRNGWNLLEEEPGDYTQAKAREVMQSFLEKYDNINVVYCENDNEAFGAIEAIEAAGKKVGFDIAGGEIMVMSFDATKEGLKQTLAGKIAVNTECNPLLAVQVENIIQSLQKGEAVDKKIYIEEDVFSASQVVKSISVDDVRYDITNPEDAFIQQRVY